VRREAVYTNSPRGIVSHRRSGRCVEASRPPRPRRARCGKRVSNATCRACYSAEHMAPPARKTVPIPRSVLAALVVGLVGLLLIVAFLIGRESTRRAPRQSAAASLQPAPVPSTAIVEEPRATASTLATEPLGANDPGLVAVLRQSLRQPLAACRRPHPPRPFRRAAGAAGPALPEEIEGSGSGNETLASAEP
jgi:hypothetical protein